MTSLQRGIILVTGVLLAGRLLFVPVPQTWRFIGQPDAAGNLYNTQMGSCAGISLPCYPNPGGVSVREGGQLHLNPDNRVQVLAILIIGVTLFLVVAPYRTPREN